MAREIAAVLKNPQRGNGFIQTENGVVTWLVGHVLKQVEPEGYDAKYKSWCAEDLPIVPQIWKLKRRLKFMQRRDRIILPNSAF